MIRITVQTTTPTGETVERTRTFTDETQAGKYRRACEHAGREIIKEEN